MTATFAPFGLRPSRPARGGIAARQEAYTIASAYGSNIFSQDPVKIVAAGVINLAAAGDAMFGVFGGVEFTGSDSVFQVRPYWPASQALLSGTEAVCYLWRDPDIEYLIQANEAYAITSIGDEADHVAGTGSTLSGQSGAYLGSVVGAGNTAGFRVVGKGPQVDNAWGDAYTILRVIVNELAGFAPNPGTAV